MKKIKIYTAKEALATFVKQGAMGSVEEKALPVPTECLSTSPWYFSVLNFIGAFFAMLFFLGFLGLAHILDSQTAMLIIGAILLVYAALRSRARLFEFERQLVTVAALSGAILIFTGIPNRFRFFRGPDNTHLYITVTYLTVCWMAIRNHVWRLASCVAILLCLAFLIAQSRNYIVASFFLGLVTLGTIALWKFEVLLRVQFGKRVQRSLAIGFTVFLLVNYLVTIGRMTSFLMFGRTSLYVFFPYGWESAITFLLGSGLLAYEYFLPRKKKVPLAQQIAVGIAVAFAAIAGYWIPGVVLGLTLAVLGWKNSNRALIGLAIVFMAVYISYYYYFLGISLLTKSIYLMATGVVCLMGAGGLVAMERQTQRVAR